MSKIYFLFPINRGREGGDLCGCKNHVLISMGRFDFGSRVLLLVSPRLIFLEVFAPGCLVVFSVPWSVSAVIPRPELSTAPLLVCATVRCRPNPSHRLVLALTATSVSPHRFFICLSSSWSHVTLLEFLAAPMFTVLVPAASFLLPS
jgi:hypothetical protein